MLEGERKELQRGIGWLDKYWSRTRQQGIGDVGGKEEGKGVPFFKSSERGEK